jgi:hypothetical protein
MGEWTEAGAVVQATWIRAKCPTECQEGSRTDTEGNGCAPT